MSTLGRIKVTRKCGEEKLKSGGQDIGCSLLDFWQWSVSDLVSNATRGRLAEFIVAKALGILVNTTVRDEWAAYDLVGPGGAKVEVKSAAFLQSWHQDHPSSIRFVVPKTRAWDPSTNVLSAESKRQADVYVFAVLKEREDKDKLDPLDVDQWDFYVLPTATLDARTGSQHSITLKSLREREGGPVDYWHLAGRVANLASAKPEGTVQSITAESGRAPLANSSVRGPVPRS